MVIFCFGPLPGETARVRITAVKPKYAVVEMLQLVVRAVDRAEPFCPVFGQCGGCQLQHLTYAAQLHWKRTLVRNALQRIGDLGDVLVREPIGMSAPRHYRNKMSLVVKHEGAQTRFGFYRQRSHDVVPIQGCPVVLPALDRIIASLDRARQDERFRPILSRARHVVARSSHAGDQAVVTVTTSVAEKAVADSGQALMGALPGVTGITNSYDISGANVILGRRHLAVGGRAYIEEEIQGVRYRVSPASFFQVNTAIVSRIMRFMQPGLRRPHQIVDLYCGTGTFALFFAKMGSQVYGIEESAAAIREAGENAQLNGLGDRVRFHRGSVEHAVSTPVGRSALQDAHIAFLDPPRKGSDPRTLDALANAGVPHVWYLSCDPATLARDLKFLAAKGYRLGVVQPFDMFPHTGHVETLVTLYRERPGDETLEIGPSSN